MGLEEISVNRLHVVDSITMASSLSIKQNSNEEDAMEDNAGSHCSEVGHNTSTQDTSSHTHVGNRNSNDIADSLQLAAPGNVSSESNQVWLRVILDGLKDTVNEVVKEEIEPLWKEGWDKEDCGRRWDKYKEGPIFLTFVPSPSAIFLVHLLPPRFDLFLHNFLHNVQVAWSTGRSCPLSLMTKQRNLITISHLFRPPVKGETVER